MDERRRDTEEAAPSTRRISGVRLLAWVVFFALVFSIWTAYDYYRTGFFENSYYAVAFAVLAGLALFTLFVAVRRPTDVGTMIATPSAPTQDAGTSEMDAPDTAGPRPAEMVRRTHTHPTSRGAVSRTEYELGGLRATDYRIEAGGRRWDLSAIEANLDKIYLPITRTPDASDGAEASATRTPGSQGVRGASA